jgi:sugar phosphate isomerase/epimerase
MHHCNEEHVESSGSAASLSRRHFIQSTVTAGSLLGSGFFSSMALAQTAAPRVSGLKASIAAYSFRDQLPYKGKTGKTNLHTLFEWIADQGLGAVEPTSYYFSAEDPEYLHSLKAKAFREGLDISGTAIANDFTHVDEAVRDESIAHVKRWVDHSVKLGAPVIRIFAGNKHKEVSDEQALAWVIECMKECCDYAGERGTFLAIENHGYLTGTSKDLMKIVDGVKHEWIGVNLDTGNFTEDPYGNIERMAPYAVNVQLKTEVRKADGSGKEDADVDRIVKLLNDGGYRGYVALEFEGDDKGDPYGTIPSYIQQLQGAIEQGAK